MRWLFFAVATAAGTAASVDNARREKNSSPPLALQRKRFEGHNVPNVMNLTDSYIPNPFNQVISLFVQVAMTADRRGVI